VVQLTKAVLDIWWTVESNPHCVVFSWCLSLP